MTDTTRWILAFDSSCSRCARISANVAQTCGGKLEVVPLARPEVVRWRELSLGRNPRWAPTLLKVKEKRVQGWTGLSMVGPMIRALGPRSTINVLRALGRQQAERMGDGPEPSVTNTRCCALSELRSGLLTAGGFVLTGRLSSGVSPKWPRREENRISPGQIS